MTGLAGLWHVALREIKERGRSKAFLITTAVTLAAVVGLIVVPQLLAGGTDEYTVGVLGEGTEGIVRSAELLANADDEPGEEASVLIETRSFPDESAATQALEEGAVDAVLVGEGEVIAETAGFGGSSLVGLLQQGAATLRLETLVADQGQAAAEVLEVMTSDPLEVRSLAGDDGTDDSDEVLAYAGMFLLYLAVLLYGSWILTGVTEEKSNRVVEVLLSTIKPWQLLGGKIVGIGALGITQFALTVIAGAIALSATGIVELPDFTGGAVIHLVVWFVLGFLLFAFMFGAAGSLVSRMEDAQSVAFPMTMSAVAGFFVAIAALDDPDGTVAVIGTYVPLTAPFVVPVRAALDSISPVEYAASVLLMLATIAGLIFIGGRIYRGGLLRFGTRVGLREAWRSAD